MQVKKLFQFTPERFRYLTEQRYFWFQNHKLKSAYLLDLIHYFIIKKLLFEQKEYNLASQILKFKYNSLYHKYVDWLVMQGVLELKSKWRSGSKSKTFIFKLNLDNEKLFRYYNKDRTLIKKRNLFLEQRNQAFMNAEKLWVREQVEKDLKRVKLDFVGAMAQLDRNMDVGLIDNMSYQKNKLILENIHNDEFWIHWDDFGRLHTPFTVLRKDLRLNFLTIDGEYLQELDIPNSQPFFLSILLRNQFGINREIEEFTQTVNLGKFYETFDQMGYSRKEIKKQVYKVLFGKNGNDTTNRIFRQRWPIVWECIKNYKSKFGDHARLAHDLQKLESDLIFYNIIHKIKKIDYNLPCITIHDSLMFKPSDQSIFHEIFNQELENIKNGKS